VSRSALAKLKTKVAT